MEKIILSLCFTQFNKNINVENSQNCEKNWVDENREYYSIAPSETIFS